MIKNYFFIYLGLLYLFSFLALEIFKEVLIHHLQVLNGRKM